MSRLLLCVCLIGVAIFATATFLPTQSLHGRASTEATLVVHHPSAKEVVLPVTLTPGPAAKRRIEWVQAARYMTVARAEPSASAPVLFASTYGRPLRVIGREAAFVRVQDLGNGQIGWVETRALAPFFGGYRQREAPPTPLVVAESKPSPEATLETMQVAAAPEAAVKPKRLAREGYSPPRTKKVAVNAGWSGRIFKNDRPGFHRVAERRRHGGIAGLMQRAFRGL